MKPEIIDGGAEEATEEYNCIDTTRDVYKAYAISYMERWGLYLQSCLWGFNMGKVKLSQIPYPVVHCWNRSLHTYYYMTLPDITPAGYLHAYCE